MGEREVEKERGWGGEVDGLGVRGGGHFIVPQ